jgi:hypothetical protein
MLSVIIQNDIMVSVIILNVIMLSVVALQQMVFQQGLTAGAFIGAMITSVIYSVP